MTFIVSKKHYSDRLLDRMTPTCLGQYSRFYLELRLGRGHWSGAVNIQFFLYGILLKALPQITNYLLYRLQGVVGDKVVGSS